MSQKKLIIVFGATGAQGGGLVNAILNDKNSEFSVRAVTRNSGSDKAKEIAERGAEIVEADIDNPQSVRDALKGACAYGIFREGEKMIGKTVGVAGDQLTCDDALSGMPAMIIL